MEDENQVEAYAGADFEEPHGHFIELIKEDFSKDRITGCCLDLGCGPGDITFRFAASFRDCTVDAVDGSATMLQFASKRLAQCESMKNRISFLEGRLPDFALPHNHYNFIFSNSLLHHLPDPDILWSVVKRYSRPGTGVFIMDLRRPEDTQSALQFVKTYAADEPAVLRRDFFNSLIAAFTTEEVAAQLQHHGLDYLTLTEVSDRHLTVSGRIC